MNKMITYLDGVPCTRHNAILLHRKIIPVSVTNYDDWIAGAPNPIKLKKSTYSYSKITLTYFVEGINEKDTLKNISNLIKAHIEATLAFNDLNLKYHIIYDSSTQNHIKHQFYELTIVLKADFKLDQTKNFKLSESGAVECTSNVDTPAKLTITSESNYTDVIITINDDIFTIPSINAGDVIEINGNDCLINLNNTPNIEVVELWQFPLLKSGINNITINKANINVEIEYTERFI